LTFFPSTWVLTYNTHFIYVFYTTVPMECKLSVSKAILWPGTVICERLGIDPESDAGLVRWMINTLIHLFVCLAGVWIFAV